MTDIVIGPGFAAEIEAAGLMGLAFSWSAQGVTYGADLTTQQRAAIEAVVAAHDPASLGKPALIAHAADARWRREVGGILVGTVPVATDDRSKTMVLGARVAAAANPAWETVWHGADGTAAVESFSIQGLAHGVPLATEAAAPLGQAGPFMLEAGISSTARIAEAWGLADASDVEQAEGAVSSAKTARPQSATSAMRDRVASFGKPSPKRPAAAATDAEEGIGKVINTALRAAGLLR